MRGVLGERVGLEEDGEITIELEVLVVDSDHFGAHAVGFFTFLLRYGRSIHL